MPSTPVSGSTDMQERGMQGPLVSIRDLKLEAATPRGTAHILRGINLDIGRGRILGVVGESGSGKSSLAACMLRLLPANITRLSGELLFDGVNTLELGETEMKRLSRQAHCP